MLPRNGFCLLFAICCITVSNTANTEDQQQQSTIAVYDEEQGRLVDISQLQNKLEILTRPSEGSTRPKPPRRPSSSYYVPPPTYYGPYIPPPHYHVPQKPSRHRCRLPQQSRAIREFCSGTLNDDLTLCKRSCSTSSLNMCSPLCSIVPLLVALEEYCSEECIDSTDIDCVKPPSTNADVVALASDCDIPGAAAANRNCALLCLAYPSTTTTPVFDFCDEALARVSRRSAVSSPDPCANTDPSICYNACGVDPLISWCPYNSRSRSSSSRRRPSRQELSQYFE